VSGVDSIIVRRSTGRSEEGAIMMSDAAESDRESVVDAINDFAASFDADDDEGVAMGLYNADDGDAGGGRGQTRRKGKVECS